jgi:hypothetical protein
MAGAADATPVAFAAGAIELRVSILTRPLLPLARLCPGRARQSRIFSRPLTCGARKC